MADGKLYAGDEDGDLVVMAADKGKKVEPDKIKPGAPENEPTVISETNLGWPVYGTPIVANGVIYVQSNMHLFAFYDAGKKGGPVDQPARLDLDLKKE